MKRIHKILMVTGMLVFTFLTRTWGYYLLDNFSSGNNWITNLKYNLTLGVWTNIYSGAGTEKTNWYTTANKLVIDNGYIATPVLYTTSRYGAYALFTNTNYSSSKEQPFGFEITRNRLWQDNGASSYESGTMDVVIVEKDAAVTNGNTVDGLSGKKFNQFAALSEIERRSQSTTSYFGWSQAILPGSKIPLTSVTDSSGNVNSLQNLLEWNHGNAVNPTNVRYRFVMDGDTLSWYVNPDPYDQYANYSNSFYFIDSIPVSFSSNLQFMFGLTTMTYHGGVNPVELQLSNFVIRTVSSNLVSELSPGRMKANTTARMYLAVRPTFSTNAEAGVGELYVDLPDSVTNFTNWTAYTNAVSVHWVNTNGTLIKSFTNIFGDRNPGSNIVSISLKDGGKRLKIRFCSSNSVAVSDVFHPLKFGGNANSNAILIIISNYTTSPSADSTGRELTVYANNEKYNDTSWTNTATTSKMRSTAGNAMAMGLITNTLTDSDTLTYRTYNSPVAFSSVSPGKVYEGVSTVYLYDVQAADTNNSADVTRMTLYIPTGFGVDTNLMYSEKMGVSNGLYLYITNLNGTNAIVADYNQKGTYLPANGGWDTLTFKCTNTTNVADGSSGVTVRWTAEVYSSLTLNATNALTNDFYPSQDLLVRKKPPQGTMMVTPYQVSNTTVTNTYEFVVKNTATEDPNRIKLVRIKLPAVFTNAFNIVSLSNGVVTTAVTNGSNWITVSYTNSPPDTYIPANGGYDIIQMSLVDNIAALADITNYGVNGEADNLNGDGFSSLNADPAGTLDIVFYTPPANGYGYISTPGAEGGIGNFHHIYTDQDSETNLMLAIENRGEEGNVISTARIVFSAGITNIQYVGDTKSASNFITNEMTNMGGGVTNTNIVLTLTYTNTLKPKIGATLAEVDYISLKFWDAIDSPGEHPIGISVKNSKTNYTAVSETPENAKLTYLYPQLSASGSVTAPGGFIDWSTVTNTVEYSITNKGRAKNEILSAQILIPAEISTNITVSSITSTLITNPAYVTYSGGVITLNYNAADSGYAFSGGKEDRITFQMIDLVTNTVTVRLTNMVTNNRTNAVLPETVSNSQNVYFRTPPVIASYKAEPGVLFVKTTTTVTDVITLTVTNAGSGNNNINFIEITSPFGAAKIVDVADEVMGASNSTSPSYFDITGSTIKIFYTNSTSNLTAGNVDRIYIYVLNDLTNEQDLGWVMQADNDLADGVGLTNVGVMAGGTNRTYMSERALAYADPNLVITSTENNTFRYSLKNGTVGSGTGKPIYRAKLVVTDPFTNVSGLTIEQPGTVAVTNIDASTRWIVVDYTGGLAAGEADNIRFDLQDNWVIGTNYVDLPSQVDYDDGGGWRGTMAETNKSTGVAFQFPPASGTGYITAGEFVPEDFTNYSYEFYLKNTGDSGNNIKLIKITPPAAITNITSVTSVVKQIAGTYDGTNVWIDYEAEGKALLSFETDTIRYTGYDNVTNGDVYGEWRFQVANATTNDESYRIDIVVPGGKSISNIVYQPVTKTSVYLEAVNAIDGSDTNKNKVWTTGVSNTFKYYVYNQSASGNNLTKTKIYIPGLPGFFDTNSIEVTNTKTASISLLNNRSEIEIVYGTPMVPGDYDIVQIKINDAYQYGETNLEWTNDAAYNTTDGRYKASLEYSGNSIKSYFLMPVPTAQAGITGPVPREVYIWTTNYTLSYRITNSGDSGNDIFRAEVTLPSPYRALFTVGDVSNTIATNTEYNLGTGVVTLAYSNNFKANTADTVYLTLNSGILTATNYPFAAEVYNYTYSNAATDIAIDGNKLDIVGLPSYYLTPSSLSTTTTSNDVNVFVLNNTGGKTKLKKVVLSFSAPFTGIIETNSFLITNYANIMGMVTSLTLDYAADGNEVSVGGNDSLTFKLTDGFEIGDTNAAVTAYGYNGHVWVDMVRDIGGGTNLGFVMPAAAGTGKLDLNQMFTTVRETNIGVTVYNKGSGSNKLTRVKIVVPQGLTNLTVLSNQIYTDAIGSVSNNTVTIEYRTTNLFNSGTTDVVWLSFSNMIETGTNLSFQLWGVNITNGPIDSSYVGLPGEGGPGALNLRIDFPGVTVQGYVSGRSQLFTIDTNDQIEYRIYNGSINTYLTNAEIYYDSNLITITGVSNSWSGALVTVMTDRIRVDYTNSGPGIQFSQRDIMKINVNYSLTNPTNMTLLSKAWLVGVTNGIFDTVDAGFTQELDVVDASWGKIKGDLYPQQYPVNMKLYYPGTGTVATNIEGALAGTISGTNGWYEFTRIPSGSYTMELSASRFRLATAEITVDPNVINLISTITLQNAVLNPDVTTQQVVFCYENTNTKIEFPNESFANEFSVDILLIDLTAEQKGDLNANEKVAGPSSTAGLKGYWFDVRNAGNAEKAGEVLELDAVLTLSYNQADIESRGWTEDTLAIYYWDKVTKKWVKIGGTVDKANDVVTAKVSYVHDIYGVFGGKTAEGVIRNVTVRPKIFTPTKDANGYFGNVRITFELDALSAPDGYDVKIYDMRGNLIKSFTRKGSYSQGEVAWDSRDDDGYPVKGGVYIYRVTAGGNAYSGTIVIAR